MTVALERKLTWQDRMASQWEQFKLPAAMLAVGLIARAAFSNYMGWQVTRGAADRQSMASAVEPQARICAFNAKAVTPDTAGMGWAPRRDLAEKYAIMPGRDAAEPGVANACAQYLSAS